MNCSLIFIKVLPPFEDMYIHALVQGDTDITALYYKNPPLIEHLLYVRHCVELSACLITQQVDNNYKKL